MAGAVQTIRNIEATTLKNGVRVISEEMPHVRSVSMGVWIKTGSRRETSEENGISHFIEHMLFKGTKNRSAEDIARSVDSIGGGLDAFTAKEMVCYSTKVLDEHLPIAFDVVADMVRNPLFRDEDIEKEKGVILEELKMEADSPDYLVHEIFSSNFWKDHPLGKPILGTRETVKKYDRAMVQSFYSSIYAPANMLITAAGNLAHERMVALVREHFEDVAPGQPLGIEGFRYADLYDAGRLRDLLDAFDRWFADTAPGPRAQFEAYRSSKGQGMTPLQRSEALLAAAPFVGRFVGKLFGVEDELERFRDGVRRNDPIWRFRKDFVKKRVLRADAAKGWTLGPEVARDAAKAALQAMTAAPIGGTTDEEATIAAAALPLLEADEVARKAAKAGGAQWTDELRARARKVRDAVAPSMAAAPAPLVGGTAATAPLAGPAASTSAGESEEASLGRAVAFALDALEAWLASRLRDARDPLRRWVTLSGLRFSSPLLFKCLSVAGQEGNRLA